MKIAVIGGTGRVGREVVAEARRRGHDVVAASTREGAADAVADIRDLDSVTRLARDADAVVVSVPPARTGADHQPWVDANAAIARTDLPARILLVGGAGSTLVDGTPIMDASDFPEMYLAEARSAGRVLDIFRGPDTRADWTIVSPAPELVDGERTGEYRTSDDDVIGQQITVPDLAVAIVDELETPRHRGARFVAAS